MKNEGGRGQVFWDVPCRKNSYWHVEGLCLQTAGIIHLVTHIHIAEDLKLDGCYLCQCSASSEGKLRSLNLALTYATEYIFDLGTVAFKNKNRNTIHVTEMHLLRLSQSHTTSLHRRWAYFASRITNKSIFLYGNHPAHLSKLSFIHYCLY